MDNLPKGLLILIGIFVGSLVIAAPLAVKMVDAGFTYITAGVLAYSVTFIVSDIISETYGRKAAQQVVNAGFVTLIVVFVLIQIGLWMPQAGWWEGNESFEEVMSSSNRIVIASLVAYMVSQSFDVWFFHRIRNATSGRFLWLRNNGSTFVSQGIDTFVWTAIALYGVLEMDELRQIFFGEWGAKMLIAALDTPLVYLGVWWLRRANRSNTDGPTKVTA